MASANKEKAGPVSYHPTRLMSRPLRYQEETVSNSTTRQPGCKPWCVRHDPEIDACFAGDVDAGEGYGGVVSLSYHVEEGHRICLDQTDGFSPAHARQLARGLMTQADLAEQPQPKCTAHARMTRDEIEPSVRRAAVEAGERAVEEFEIEHIDYVQAVDRESDERPAPIWVKTDPCDPWCTDKRFHRSSDDPEDRFHTGASLSVSMETMQAVVMGGEFRAPELTVELTRKYREREARISLGDSGDNLSAYLTLDETEMLATALLDLVREARGQTWNRPLIPAQHKCDDTSCITCRPAFTEQIGELA